MFAGRLILPAALAAGIGLGAAHAQHDSGPPPRMTSDTREYCDALAGRVAREQLSARNPAPEASALAQEGTQLCAEGRVAPGIVRLRRAWVILQAGD